MKRIRSDKQAFVIWVWIIFIMFCIPYIISTRYTVFWTDDFSDARAATEYGGSIIHNALMYTDHMYQVFQGTYSSIFLASIFSPLASENLALLRLISILNIVLFIISSYVLIKNILIQLNFAKSYEIVFLSLIIIPLLSYKSYAEILYWYTGQTVYTFPLSFGFFAVSLMFNINNNSKSKCILVFKYGLLFLLIALGCGGSLQISGVICYLILFLPIMINFQYFIDESPRVYFSKIVYFYKNHIEYFIAFMMSLALTLINLLAPGNFSRYGEIESTEVSIIKAIFYSFNMMYTTFRFYICDTTLIMFLVAAVIFGMISKKVIKYKLSIVVSLFSIGLVFISLFPVVLGYKHDNVWKYYPSRVQFVTDYSFIICIITCGYTLGLLIKSYSKNINESVVIILLCTITFPRLPEYIKPADEVLPIMITESIVTGELRDCADRIINAYNSVKQSDDVDVAVLYPKEAIEWFSVVTLSDSPNDWFNHVLAKYYKKNSVAFYRELDGQ